MSSTLGWSRFQVLFRKDVWVGIKIYAQGILWRSTIVLSGTFPLLYRDSTVSNLCAQRNFIRFKNFAPSPLSYLTVSFQWIWLRSFLFLRNLHTDRVKCGEAFLEESFSHLLPSRGAYHKCWTLLQEYAPWGVISSPHNLDCLLKKFSYSECGS